MIAQCNPVIKLDPISSATDLHNLFWCPFKPQVSPDAEEAREHTLAWLDRAGIINSSSARAYVDAMRLDLYAARCAPQLRGADLELFCDWIIYTTQLDDYLDSRDPERIRPVIVQMVSIFDYDDPDRGATAPNVFVRALADLWRQCQKIPQPWRYQLADHWAQWLEAYLIEATWRRDRLWPSLARYRQITRTTSAALPFTLLSEHLSGLYLPDRILNSSEITAMRALVPDHTMAVNDVFSARREALTDDHINSVFVIEHEYGLSHDEAVRFIAGHADGVMRHYLRIAEQLPLTCRGLDATESESAAVMRMATHLRHWFSGNLAWHVHDTARYASMIQPFDIGMVPT